MVVVAERPLLSYPTATTTITTTTKLNYSTLNSLN